MPFMLLKHFDKQGAGTEYANLADLLACLDKDGFLWIDVDKPSFEDLNRLIGPLGIHPLAIEDCLDERQVPKMEVYPNHAFILFNAYSYRDRQIRISEVDFFYSDRYVISVHGHLAEDSDFFARMRQHIVRAHGNKATAPDMLLHLMLDFIVDGKFRPIEDVQDEINRCEELILDKPGEFKPRDLMSLRGCLLDLHKSLFHEREVLARICGKDTDFIAESAIYYFRDIHDHLAKYSEYVEVNRETITNLMELYFSVINTQMNQLTNKTNRVVRRLTMITTIFMPLTLLAGIGGMSEWSMMTGPENWRIAYPLFIAAMAVIGGLNYLLIRKSGKD
jgi:magnesium transporter